MIVLTFDIWRFFWSRKIFLKMKVTEVHSSLQGSPENDDSVRKTPFAKPCTYCSCGIFCQNERGGGCRLKNHGMNSGEILLSH